MYICSADALNRYRQNIDIEAFHALNMNFIHLYKILSEKKAMHIRAVVCNWAYRVNPLYFDGTCRALMFNDVMFFVNKFPKHFSTL